MSVILVLSFFGLFSGVTTVLFGFGGGFVAVPLIYRLISTTHPAEAMHVAVATSTAVMIFNSTFSTYRNNQYVIWDSVFPIALYIALGAVAGALLSMSLADGLIRGLFIVYLSVTIADCLLRKGFLNSTEQAERLSGRRRLVYGLGIGGIATMLGVGGSVMTVPLLRRLGASMKSAVVMANPLSVPVAVVGTLLYCVLSYRSDIKLGAGFVGYIDAAALGVLVVTGYLGIALAGRWLPKIPDSAHARAYLAFLTLALVSML